MNRERRALISILAGLLLSSVFFLLSWGAEANVLFWPQVIGFYLVLILKGVHSATKTDFALISIPANAVVYSLVIFALSGRVLRKNTPAKD
jgi:hypothetical protein